MYVCSRGNVGYTSSGVCVEEMDMAGQRRAEEKMIFLSFVGWLLKWRLRTYRISMSMLLGGLLGNSDPLCCFAFLPFGGDAGEGCYDGLVGGHRI